MENLEEINQMEEQNDSSPKVKKSKKKLIMAVFCIFVVFIFEKNINVITDNQTFGYFLKENQCYHVNLGKDVPKQVTTFFRNSDENYLITNIDAMNPVKSKDGKTIFYSDLTDGVRYPSLYYRKISKAMGKPILIDSEVIDFDVNKSGTLVSYVKNDALYQYNVKKKQGRKISNDIKTYLVSKNGKTIFYQTAAGDLFAINGTKEANRIDNGITKITHTTKDFKTVYYLKNSEIYRYKEGEGSIKIASDIVNVLTGFETGEMYYIKGNSEYITYYDFLTDANRAEDEKMISRIETDDQYRRSLSDDEYDDMHTKEWIRECFDEKVKTEYYSFFYNDGQNNEDSEVLLSDMYAYEGSRECCIAKDKAIVAFQTYAARKIYKMDINDLCRVESLDEVANTIDELLQGNIETNIAVGGKRVAKIESASHLIMKRNAPETIKEWTNKLEKDWVKIDLEDAKEYSENIIILEKFL